MTRPAGPLRIVGRWPDISKPDTRGGGKGPQNRRRGEHREDTFLAYCAEMYATDYWTLVEFELAIDRVLNGGYPVAKPLPPPSQVLHP